MSLTHAIYSCTTASIADLQRNPHDLIKEALVDPVVIFKHNRPAAYLVSAKTFENMIDLMDRLELAEMERRQQSGTKLVG
ncbi:type II toxin-antitoxin system prevent-host-death family antitoxin [Massilia sp. erpn]|uniref:type II toxin-antitoxin system prevent-host-death family antitoxin n=1 Tax=Massilia sp. erpn TaxID=2738142 RepID=UPI002102676E|nr:type II toxin-antitoxin system prevent-host-death family antitoxin [Massilia sp. erpn]UTY56240.1 type II toxin-antitoxin system Phd/YefM family antitoxin [Massilia sp. erpn]